MALHNDNSYTVLHWAAVGDHSEVVRYVIDEFYNWTPLLTTRCAY